MVSGGESAATGDEDADGSVVKQPLVLTESISLPTINISLRTLLVKPDEGRAGKNPMLPADRNPMWLLFYSPVTRFRFKKTREDVKTSRILL